MTVAQHGGYNTHIQVGLGDLLIRQRYFVAAAEFVVISLIALCGTENKTESSTRLSLQSPQQSTLKRDETCLLWKMVSSSLPTVCIIISKR
jgi:hypothetical protein